MFGTPSKQCANDTAVIATDDVLGTTELAAIDVNSIPKQNALFYVGGYICKKYLAKHSCKVCTSSLAWAELSDLSDSSTIRFCSKNPATAYLRQNPVSASLVKRLYLSLKNVKTFLCPISWAQCICQRYVKGWSVSF